MTASAVLASALLGPAAHAADGPIATDRPDFVESSNVVGLRRLQIETSLAWDRSDGDRSSATPTLLRYGVSDTVELRLETDGRLMQRAGAGAASSRTGGYGDVSLGMKWHLADAADQMPSTALLLHADLETGSRAFRGEGVRPSVRVVAEWELGSGYALGVMPGLSYQPGSQGGVAGIFGIVIGKSLTDQLRSFVELSAPQIGRTRRGGTEAALTVGGAYLITDMLQLDAALSRGLTRQTPDLRFTIGLSVKL